MKRLSLLLPALFVAPPLAAAQLPHAPAFDITGGHRELFAQFVSVVGDVDADGGADVAVYSVREGSPNGIVRVYSGLDGALLRAYPTVMNHPLLGQPLAGLGDLDGDGHAELIVGDKEDQGSGDNSGVARVYSGASGAEILKFSGDRRGDGFGGAVACAGDVNGDGVPDIVVGTIRSAGRGPEYARVFSGADGSVLHTLEAELERRPQFKLFGQSVAGIGDVNADGFDDLAVGAYVDGVAFLDPGFPPFVPPFWSDDHSGSVRIYSGIDGALLRTLYGEREYLGFGYSVSGLGDLDGDGHADLAAGTINLDDPSLPGYARVFSGGDGSVLDSFLDSDLHTHQFVGVAPAGDLDGDGRPELLASSRSAVRVFSGDGSQRFEFSAGGPTTLLYRAHGGADMDGDRVPDFVIACSQAFFGGGFVRVFHSRARGTGIQARPQGPLPLDAR